MGDITNNNRQVSILVPDGASYESVLPKTVASAVDTTTANVTVQDHIDDTSIHNSTTAIEGMISTALEDYTPTSELATVATTGDYDDLLDKPTIGSATITIQKNSTKVDDFSVNATSNKSINITVPVNVTDLADASSYYTSSQVDSAIATAVSSVYRYKGSVSTYSQLPSTGNVAGDVYNVEDTGANYAWTGTAWDKLSDDLTNYVTLNGTQTLKNKTIAIADNTITGLSTVATSGSYNDLSNKPTIGNAKLTIQKNSVKVGEFTANATTDKTLDITVPTTVAELSDSSDYALNADLATVAKSGSYNDLNDTPTIGSGVLTIQKNGIKVDDFSANATSNKTVNITVPTDNAELTNGAGYAKSADLATVATSGNYSDLSGTPTIGEATLTIQKNGTTIKTFGANATSNVTANITVPTDNAELTNGAGYAVASSLATVATSGSYNDLSNKPTIGNAEIEIQKNGTKVDSFTTNQTGEKQSINITVPTAVSELTNDTGYITGVAWNEVTGKPSTFTPSAHNQAANTINAMTGYSKPASTSAISTSDTLNSAIGKLETALDGKQATGDYATHSDVATALEDYTPTASLATVATSGSYNDLSDKPTIGSATLTIQKNGTTVKTFGANATSNVTANITVPTTAADVGALPSTTTINDLTTTAQQNALNSGATSTLIGKITTNETAISTINGKIPSQASSTNQLADKNFVNSSISTNTATFDGSWNTYASIPTTAQGFIDAGYESPTNNNYLIVKEDETQDGGTWRYKYASSSTTYNKNNWKVEYEVNESPMTDAQLAALNSGATSTLIGKITTNETAIGTINTTIGGYGNIVTHNTSEFATSTQGGKADTALQPNDNISELTNDAGYITGVAWDDVTGKPSTFTPSAHNQASNTINAMTGYSKPTSTSAISTSDTLNAAVGKLEKALDGKQPTGSYVTTARKINNKALSSDITLSASDVGALPDSTVIPTITDTYSSTSSDGMSGKAVASALGSYVPTTRKVNNKTLSSDITLSASDVGAAATSHNQAANTINAMTGYNKSAGTATGIVATDTLNVALAKIEQVLDTKQGGGSYVPTSRKINNKDLSSDITLTASDVGALPSSTVIPTITDTYSSTSSNGMSGKAVASAISGKQNSNTAVTHTASTKVGDTNKPVYVASNGAATVCSYELNKSVPADAVFTDTTYSDMGAATSTEAGTAGLVPAPAAGKQGSFLRGDGTWQTPTNTKNTAGSTDTSSKIFLVGATSQAASPQTYSHDTVFVDANGRVNSAAPASDANDTTVATTKWVKNQSYVPTSRTINSKALSSNITLSASDVGALPSSTVIPTITDTYSATSSNGMSGKAVASAISNKANKATSLSGYGITDAYTKTEIDGKLSGAMHFKGTKASVSNLPTTGNVQGDMWNVTDTGANYAWDGSAWDKLSENIDLSGVVPTSRKINNKALTADITLSASDVGAVASNTAITGATKCKITYDSKGLVTAGGNLAASDIPNLSLSKITDVTATATEVNVLDGITATTAELNYTDGVTSNIQTQLNAKAADNAVVKLTGDQTIAGTKTFNNAIKAKAGFDVINGGVTKGTNPTSTQYWGLFRANDKNDGTGTWQSTRLGIGEVSLDTNGKTNLMLGVYKNEADSATNSSISVGYDLTTGAYAKAPNPSASNSTATADNYIATTCWVNDASKSTNVVHRTGNETIAGTKTFSTTPVVGTMASSDNSTSAASTAFVKSQGYITSSGSITGSAAKLTTARTIDGVNFDGSASITHYAYCTTAANTVEKTINCTGFKLETGARIAIKFQYGNSAYNPTFNINGTGAIAVYYNNAAISRWLLKTNRILEFIYNGTQYEYVGEFDTTVNNQVRFQNIIKAQTAITQGRLIVGNSSGYNNISSGGTFDITYPILYCNANLAVNGTGDNNYRYITGISVRNLTGNSSWSGTQYSMVYLVLSALSGNTGTIDSTLMTTTVPTSADNKFYIPVGYMFSTYQCIFDPQPRVFAYVNGAFQEYMSYAGTAGAVAWGNVSGKPSSFTPSAHNQASNTINAMTGYSKPSSTSAISTSDTLNSAIGKLEKALDSKQASGSYVTYTASTAVGTATKPAYVASTGVATACTYELNATVPSGAVFTDTKNTAGSTDTSSKIFLVGATSQAANPQTYSHDTAFVDANGRLNSAAPASNANDTTVATTKWVKDQSYVKSSTKATTSALGLVKPDGTTITVDSAGTISAVQDTMTMVVDEFTMSASGTQITLTNTPASKVLCWVNICNTDIVSSEWSLSGNKITLSTAIPANTWGQVRYFTNVGSVTANSPLLKAKTTISNGALTLQASKKYYEATVSGNTTFKITAPSTSDVIEFYLHITHTSGTITFPSSVKWASTPSFSTGKKHLIKMLSFDGGTTYLAQLEGSFS